MGESEIFRKERPFESPNHHQHIPGAQTFFMIRWHTLAALFDASAEAARRGGISLLLARVAEV